MEYTIEIIKNTVFVNINGELDDHLSSRIREKLDLTLMRSELCNIVFDLSRLEFMDSSGIGLLMGRFRLIKNRGGQASLICHDQKVLKVLKMSGILGIFLLYETREAYFSKTIKEATIYHG